MNIIPEQKARSAVPGVRGLLIPFGNSHPGKWEHSEVQSCPPINLLFFVMDVGTSFKLFAVIG